jgi:hypothetical protein
MTAGASMCPPVENGLAFPAVTTTTRRHITPALTRDTSTRTTSRQVAAGWSQPSRTSMAASISALGLLAGIGLWSSLIQSSAKPAPMDGRPAIVRGFTAAQASNGAYVVLYGRRGKDHRQFLAPLLLRDRDRRQALAPLASGDDGSTPKVVVGDSGPCIGYNRDGQVLVACLSSARWQRRRLPAGQLLADWCPTAGGSSPSR